MQGWMEMRMRTRVLIWCGSALLIGSVVHAQQPPQAAQAKTGVVATVTATGCVERWTPQPGDTTTKPPDGVQFILTHIEGKTASATTAGAPATEKTPPAAHYLLLPQPSLNLAAHVNHRVRVDGTIAPQPTEGASPADVAINPAARETNLPEAPESKSYRDNLIDVKSLTMVAGTCGK
jgi:hypothetical protein